MSCVFKSRVPQRAKPGALPGQSASTSSLVGPGAYTPKPGAGQPFWRDWLIDPTRQQSAFASRTVKAPIPKPLTADIDIGTTFGDRGSKKFRGSAPGAYGRSWKGSERRPPPFHVPFRAYPLEGGEPRGREPGLDVFYNVDDAVASPIGLHGTLVANMVRTDRTYAVAFKSKVPARPQGDCRLGSGDLGPGSYKLPRSQSSSIVMHDPMRPSPWACLDSGGKYANVGDKIDEDAPYKSPTGSDAILAIEAAEDARASAELKQQRRAEHDEWVVARLYPSATIAEATARNRPSLARAYSAPGNVSRDAAAITSSPSPWR